MQVVNDPRVNPSLDDNFALKFASNFGHLDVLNRLLEDPRLDLSAIDHITIKWASQNNHIDVVQRLLEEERVWSSLSSTEREKYLKRFNSSRYNGWLLFITRSN